MHSCLILSCLLQMDWRTVHDESIPLGRFALHRFHLLNRRYFWFVSSTLKETGLQNRSEFLEKKTIAHCQSIVPLWLAMRYRWSRSRCVNP